MPRKSICMKNVCRFVWHFILSKLTSYSGGGPIFRRLGSSADHTSNRVSYPTDLLQPVEVGPFRWPGLRSLKSPLFLSKTHIKNLIPISLFSTEALY